MGSSSLVYQKKFEKVFLESKIHIQRINEAFTELEGTYTFPISIKDFDTLVNNKD